MRSDRFLFAITVLLLTWAFGCGATDDIGSGQAFLAAFPSEDVLTIQTAQLGQDQGGLSQIDQRLVGDRADLHDLSFMVAYRVNRQTRNLLETIWWITRFPPTAALREDGVLNPGTEDEFAYDARAVWGPFQEDRGRNLELILHVWRGVDPDDGRRTFLWFAAGRPVGGGEDAWVPFLVGGAKPFAPGFGTRLGAVELDMDAVRTLDPTEVEVGVATYVYMEAADHHVVAAVGEGVWADEQRTYTTDATYLFGRSAEGYAVLEFQAQLDLQDDAGDALETVQVDTAWLYDGHGRSDATVSGGDLGAGSASLTECWGVDLKQTYFHFETEGITPVQQVEDGDVTSCLSQTPIDVPDFDYQALRDAFD